MSPFAVMRLRPAAGAAGASLVWNSADKDADVTLSGSNLVASLTTAGATYGGVRGNNGMAHTLDRYAVVEVSTVSLVGLSKAGANLDYPGADANGYGFYPYANAYYNNGAPTGTPFLSNADVVGIAYDADAGTIRIRLSGKYYDTAFTITANTTLYPMWGAGSGAGSRSSTLNTGGSNFVLGLPEGYSAWGGTWNSADKGAGVTLSGSDLIASTTNSVNSVRGTQARSSGKYYFELTRSAGDNVYLAGVGTSAATLSSYPGYDTTGWSYYKSGDQKYTNNSPAALPSERTLIKVGVHLNAGQVRWFADGEASSYVTIASGTWFPMWGSGTSVPGTYTGTLLTGTLPWQPAGSTAWG